MAASGLQAASDWLPGKGVPGVDGYIGALLVWDDGQGSALYAGGQFQLAGDALAANIARWDGTEWSAMGSGLDGLVAALEVYDDHLIAGGNFTFTAGGQSITSSLAWWNGTNWLPIDGAPTDTVFALGVYAGELIAGGAFTSAGGVAANGIARWDGTTWRAFGGNPQGFVTALTTYRGELIAGGLAQANGVSTGHIARWNGANWVTLGTGLDNGTDEVWVRALTVQDDAVIAGGWFATAGGVAARNVARWDGANWSALGAGIDASISDLLVFNGQLIAGRPRADGCGDCSGPTIANRDPVLRWDGTTWSPVGETQQSVVALGVYNGELIAGGDASSQGSSSAARWDGSRWRALGDGLNGVVLALTAHQGALVAGGSFTVAGNSAGLYVARWNDGDWSALGGGMPGFVTALASGNGELIAGMDNGDGSSQSYPMARWNGTEWQPFGVGLNGRVLDLLRFRGEWVAAGWVGTADAPLEQAIVHGSDDNWAALGGGVLSFSGTGGMVSALAVYRGELVAGGAFGTAGGVPAANIARWDGLNWASLGAGMANGSPNLAVVNALIEYRGELVAGGEFSSADGVPVSNIARWDGTRWAPLGSGITDGGSQEAVVRALAVFEGELIAGGHFSSAGGVSVKHIARWNGTEWAALGSGVTAANGVDGSVNALTVHDGRLAVGGSFTTAGGHTSAYFARWGPPETDNPTDPGNPGGGPIRFCGSGLLGTSPLMLIGAAMLRRGASRRSRRTTVRTS